MASVFLVLAVGLVAGCLSGVIGTGSSLMLLPVLTYQFGPKHAVPVMAVAAVIANLSRVAASTVDSQTVNRGRATCTGSSPNT
ncbi:TSUP family transporter [Luteibacter sp.]|uniref:TSUP family transporter n=1 Tax=Luteibacter sp. TaxID=1886636 RepID=UPI0039C9C083